VQAKRQVLYDSQQQEVPALTKLARKKGGKVQDLGFSPNDQFLGTLGGPDDNAVVVR